MRITGILSKAASGLVAALPRCVLHVPGNWEQGQFFFFPFLGCALAQSDLAFLIAGVSLAGFCGVWSDFGFA